MADGELIININANTANVQAGLEKVNQDVRQLGDTAKTSAGGFGEFAKSALAFAIGGIIQQGFQALTGTVIDFFKTGIEQSNQWTQAMNQVNAVIKSTGGAAGVSATEVKELADRLGAGGGLSRAADDSVASMEAMVLTFTNIGHNVFPQTTQAILDMATAMNNGASPSTEQLTKNAILVGKALNDPIKGLTALQRVGVTFSESQKQVIQQMVKTGDTAGAQKVILDELAKEFGGSAAASVHSFGGEMDVLHEKIANVAGVIGDALLSAVQDAMPTILKVVDAFSEWVPRIISAAVAIGQQLAPAILAIIHGALDVFKGLIDATKIAFDKLTGSMNDSGGVMNGVLKPVFEWLKDNGSAVGNVIGVLAVAWAGYTVAQTAANVVVGIWDALTSPWIAIILAIAAAVGMLIFAWDQFKQAFQDVVDLVELGLQALKVVWESDFGHIQEIVGMFGSQIQGLVIIVQNVFGLIGNVVETFTTDFIRYIQFLVENIGQLFTAMGDIMEGKYQDASNILVGMAIDFGQQMKELHRQIGVDSGDALANGLDDSRPAVSNAADSVATTVATTLDISGRIRALGGNIGSGYGTGIAAGIAAAGPAISGQVNAVISDLQRGVAAINQLRTQAGLAPLGVGTPTPNDYVLPPTYNLNSNVPYDPAQVGSSGQAAIDARNKAIAKALGNDYAYNPTPPAGGGGGGGGGKGGGGGGSKGTTVDAIKAAADEAKAFADAVNSALSGISNVMNLSVPQGFADKVNQLSNLLGIAVNSMQAVAVKFGAGALTAVSAFADAAGKVFDAFNKAFDFFTKIADTGDKVLNGSAKLVTLTNELAQKIVIVMNTLGPMVSMWSLAASEQVGAFAEASSKVFDMLSKALDFFQKIGDVGDKILNGSAKLVTLTNELAQKIVIVMNTLGPMVSLWNDKADTTVGNFAEASGKVFDALSKAFDFFTKINETGEKVLNGAAKLASLTVQLVEKVVIVMNTLGPMVALWNDAADTTVSGFADASGKVFDGLSKAFDFFTKIVDVGNKVLNGAAQLVTLTNQLSEKVVITMNVLGPMVALWDEKADTLVSQFADASGKVFDGLSKALDFFQKLADTGRKILAAAVDLAGLSLALENAVVAVMNSLGPMVALWDSKADTLVSQFADAAGHVFDSLSKAVDFFTRLAGADKVSFANLAGRVHEIENATADMMNNFVPVLRDWGTVNEQGKTLAAQVAEFVTSAATVADGLGKAVGFFDILAASKAGFAGLAGRVQELATATAGMMNAFGPVAFGWQTFNTMVTAFAQTVGAVADNLGKVVSLFGGLSSETFKVPTGAVMSAFFDGLGAMLNEFKQRSTSWSNEADADTAALAGYVGSIMDGIGKAVQPLMSLATFKPVPTSVIDSFFDTLGTFLNAFASRAETFKGSATDTVAKIAANIGTIAESLGKVVDPLLKVLGFKAPDNATPNPTTTIVNGAIQIKDAGASGMGAFFNSLTDFITEFAARSSQWVAANDKTVQSIAEGIGTVMSGVGAAIDPLVKLQTFKAPGMSTIDSFFNAMSAFISKLHDLIAQIPADFVANAVAFAAGINQMFGDLSNAMTTAAGIKTPADLPDIFKNILTAIQQVVDYMQNTAVSAWSSALNKMVTDAQQAADAIIKAIQSIPPWPVPPGSTPPGSTPPPGNQPPGGVPPAGQPGLPGRTGAPVHSQSQLWTPLNNNNSSNFNSGGSVVLNLYLDGMQVSPQQLSQRLGLRARITEIRT